MLQAEKVSRRCPRISERHRNGHQALKNHKSQSWDLGWHPPCQSFPACVSLSFLTLKPFIIWIVCIKFSLSEFRLVPEHFSNCLCFCMYRFVIFFNKRLSERRNRKFFWQNRQGCHTLSQSLGMHPWQRTAPGWAFSCMFSPLSPSTMPQWILHLLHVSCVKGKYLGWPGIQGYRLWIFSFPVLLSDSVFPSNCCGYLPLLNENSNIYSPHLTGCIDGLCSK